MIDSIHKKAEEIILNAYETGGIVILRDEAMNNSALQNILQLYMIKNDNFSEFKLNAKGWGFAASGCWTGEEERQRQKEVELNQLAYLTELQKTNLELQKTNFELSNKDYAWKLRTNWMSFSVSLVAIIISFITLLLSILR